MILRYFIWVLVMLVYFAVGKTKEREREKKEKKAA